MSLCAPVRARRVAGGDPHEPARHWYVFVWRRKLCADAIVVVGSLISVQCLWKGRGPRAHFPRSKAPSTAIPARRDRGPRTTYNDLLSIVAPVLCGGWRECQSCVGRHASCIVTASTHFWSFERCALTFTVVVERRGDPGALDGKADPCADILPRDRSRHKYLILIHGNTTPRASAHHREGTKGRAPAFSLRL